MCDCEVESSLGMRFWLIRALWGVRLVSSVSVSTGNVHLGLRLRRLIIFLHPTACSRIRIGSRKQKVSFPPSSFPLLLPRAKSNTSHTNPLGSSIHSVRPKRSELPSITSSRSARTTWLTDAVFAAFALAQPCGQCIARKVPNLCRPFINGVEDPTM